MSENFSCYCRIRNSDCDTNGNNLSARWDRSHLWDYGALLMVGMGTNLDSGRVLTFDVGGSHVSAAVCLKEDYRLGPVVHGQYDSIETTDGFIDLLCRLGREAVTGHANGMGATLAFPGPFNLQAGISLMRHKLSYLYGVDLRKALAERLGCAPDRVRFLNDADAYLLGEIGAGAARGFARVIGLTLGTGVGSAFAVNGKLVAEGPGVPPGGEIWNVPYHGGIVEDFVSARAIAGHYERSTGSRCSVASLASAAGHDRQAAEAFAEFGRHLGCVLSALVADFHADLVVLGGGIARSPNLFLQSTRGELPNGASELRISELMDRAPLVGCGVAWFDRAGSSSDGGRTAAALDGAIQA